MKFARPVPALLALTALLGVGLVGCRSDARGGTAEDLTAQVLFTVNGTYDARADRRERVGNGLRRITWTSRPPLPARAVVVRFDGNVRSLSWDLEVEGPDFSARSLAGEGAATVSTPQGEGLRPRGGRLAEVLILRTPEGLRLVTRGFVIREEPALLPAFRGQ
ncbi:hypothetical protein DAETH_09260 [Deinococcus aetherius]|uniref:Lipoprotein n=1 Tax=Deinococcus aetherius TaxID=200252 RepID=A0ABM8AB17_9DEIO|nr:hypothetical protein [Deinococcus aetherius]BDP40957.1 hypothetical protein DAETH_09260 [Deinococcus aetherius]